jgi:putative ABC transport system ATP-binding protein
MPWINISLSYIYISAVQKLTDSIDRKTVVLNVENVSKTYDSAAGKIVALMNINFTIKKREFVSIVGPSGSGKSTLLNIIGALDKPSSGMVVIDGVDLFSLRDSEISRIRSKLIGFIFQSYNLINRMTAQENVEFPDVLAESSGTNDRHRRSVGLLEALGIKDKAKLKPTSLSGGEQQRVAIARALINNPSVILADEPTGNLDTRTGRQIVDMLRSMCSKYGTTIVMVTHNTEFARLTDRSVYLKDGIIERVEVN